LAASPGVELEALDPGETRAMALSMLGEPRSAVGSASRVILFSYLMEGRVADASLGCGLPGGLWG
jgi:hypothetical protein